MYILGQIWIQLCPFYFCIFWLLSASTPPYSQPRLAGSQNLFCKRPGSKNTNLFKLRPYLEEIWIKENNQSAVHSWSITWEATAHTGLGASAQGGPSVPPCHCCSPWAPAQQTGAGPWKWGVQQHTINSIRTMAESSQLIQASSTGSILTATGTWL